jgi:O-antigen/teichoic acid export membrane protein
LIGSILIVRALAIADYGTFSYYLWLAGLAQISGTLGFPTALTKIVSELRGRGEHIEARRLAIALVGALFGLNFIIGVTVALWAIFGSPATRDYLLVVAVVPLFNSLSAMLSSTLWSYEEFKAASLVNMLAAPIQLTLIGAAYYFSWGVAGFLAAALSPNIVNGLALSVVVYRFLSRESAVWARLPRRDTCWRYVAFAVPTSLLVVADTIVWQRSEVFFLNQLSAIEQVGFYSLAFTAYGMFLSLGWSFVVGFYPTISHDYGAGDWARIRQSIEQSVVLATMYAVPISLGSWVTLESLIRLLYTDKMLPAVLPALILFSGLLAGTVAGVFGVIISALRYIWLHVGFGLVVMVVNIMLDIILIPAWGATGAAIANAGAQISYSLLLYLFLRRRCQLALPWMKLGTIIAIGALTTFLLPRGIVAEIPHVGGLVLAIVVSGCCYVAALWRFGFFRIKSFDHEAS